MKPTNPDTPENRVRSETATKGMEAGLYCGDSKWLPPSQLKLHLQTAIFHGRQNFLLRQDSINPLQRDHLLNKKQDMLRPFFVPRYLANRKLLDLQAAFGFFSFWALQQGLARAVAIDTEQAHLQLGKDAAHTLKIQSIDFFQNRIAKWNEPADIVLALDATHWLYSSTVEMGSLSVLVRKLTQITRYMLIVEWVDPTDPSSAAMNNLDQEQNLIVGTYSPAALEALLKENFARYECIGTVSPTRRLYIAFTALWEQDLSGPLPLILPAENLLSCRLLTKYEGIDYWSAVYDDGTSIYKQASLDLARREGSILSLLDAEYFPKVLQSSSQGAYSTLVLERIAGLPLMGAAASSFIGLDNLIAFILHCLNILDILKERGIRHRDIREENILVRDEKPVLIDFGWAETTTMPLFAPRNLGTPHRPPDGSFCDVYSMGRVFDSLNRHNYLSLDKVIELMTEPDASLRITDLHTLRMLFLLQSKSAAALAMGSSQFPASLCESCKQKEVVVKCLLDQLLVRKRNAVSLSAENEVLTKKLAEQEYAIRQVLVEKENYLAQNEEYLSCLQKRVTGLDQHARLMETEVKARGDYIDCLQRFLAERDQYFAYMEVQEARREETLMKLENELFEMTETVGRLRSELAEREAEIDRLKKSPGNRVIRQ